MFVPSKLLKSMIEKSRWKKKEVVWANKLRCVFYDWAQWIFVFMSCILPYFDPDGSIDLLSSPWGKCLRRLRSENLYRWLWWRWHLLINVCLAAVLSLRRWTGGYIDLISVSNDIVEFSSSNLLIFFSWGRFKPAPNLFASDDPHRYHSSPHHPGLQCLWLYVRSKTVPSPHI